MKQCSGQLKGESSDWSGVKLLGFLFYTRSGLSLSPRLVSSSHTCFLFYFSRADLLAWQSHWHIWQKMISPPPEGLDWLHLWSVTLSENASLLLIQSSSVCAEGSRSQTERTEETTERRRRKKKGACYNIRHGNVLWCHSRADRRSDGAVTVRGAALTRLYRTNRRRNLYASGTSVENGTAAWHVSGGEQEESGVEG